MQTIVYDNVQDINLAHIFECGQCFRWNDELGDGSYIGVAASHICHANLRGAELTLEVSGGSRDFWSDYLDLATDYSRYKAELIAREPRIATAIDHGYGIRILKQDFFEVLISFIISQNNNIPRIKRCIENLCERYGEPIAEYAGKMRYAFPRAEVLASCTAEELSEIRLGYRSNYIINASVKYLASGAPHIPAPLGDSGSAALAATAGLSSLERPTSGESVSAASNSPEEIHKALLTYHGVGPKVANCIQLFGVRDMRAFPIDVWVKRIMSDMYGFDPSDTRGMQEFARDKYGALSGIAQQYLFYFYREKK